MKKWIIAERGNTFLSLSPLRPPWEHLGAQASQMPPRCIPDGSQMLPDGTQMVPLSPQMVPRWLQDVSQIAPRCLPDAFQMGPR